MNGNFATFFKMLIPKKY